MIEELINSTGNRNIHVRKLDLSSLSSVREFAEQINREETRLDVLIHNAGTAESFKKKVSEDGLELTMATNHYGPFLLTHLLIGKEKIIRNFLIYNCIINPQDFPRSNKINYFLRSLELLKKSAPSRIVVVASELYRFACLNLDNPNPTTTFPGYLYYVSKYANIVFTQELARRLEGSGVTANCLHPGMMDSGIWRNVPAPLSWPLNLIIKAFFKTPEQGAQTSIYLAVSDDVIGVTGKYFMDCHVR